MTYKHIWLTAINRADTGKMPISEGDLKPHEQESLIKIYTDHYGGEFTGNDRYNATRILERLQNLKLWLACSCHSTNDVDFDFRTAPVLFSKRIPGKDNEGLTLVRAPLRSPHHEECPFFRAQDSESTSTSKNSNINFEQTKIDSDELFSILKPVNYIAAPRNSVETKHFDGNANSGQKQTNLSRILLSAMDKAGLNLIDRRKYMPNMHEQLEALRKTFSDCFYDKGKKLSVRSHTEVSLDKLRRLSMTIRNSQSLEKYNVVPQGFLIGVAKSFEKRTFITIENTELEIETPIILSGQNPKGPYLVIVLVGCRNKGTFYLPLMAFAQPVFSENLLVPVDSNLERKTLQCLLDCQREKGFAIYKPIADETVHIFKEKVVAKEGTSFDVTQAKRVRPDFKLNYDSKKLLIVETMGYTTDVYLERKQRTHEAMKALGPIVEHRPDVDSDQSFIDQL